MADKRIYELTEASTVGSSDVLALDSQNMAQTKKVKVKTITDPLSDKYDIASLNLTGSTNTSGGTIEAGRYFYLNGDLVKAKTDIAAGATFTAGTNYVSAYVGADLAEVKQTLSTVSEDLSHLYDFRQVSIAYTQNSYITESDFALIKLLFKGVYGVILFNSNFSSIPANTGPVAIGKLPYKLSSEVIQVLPCQKNGSSVLFLYIHQGSGVMEIYNSSPNSPSEAGRYRAMIPVIMPNEIIPTT